MRKWSQGLSRWLPALFFMVIIFLVSSRAAYELPSFDWADRIIKKGGHMVGYALLALSYWHALGFRGEKRWLAWVLTVIYAATDEFHQSFVPGRNASIWDVLLFDNGGALISLYFASWYRKQKRPDVVRPIVEQAEVKDS